MPRWEEQSPRSLAPDRAASMQPEETEAGAWWAWGLWSQEPRPWKASTGWRRGEGGGFRRRTCWSGGWEEPQQRGGLRAAVDGSRSWCLQMPPGDVTRL